MFFKDKGLLGINARNLLYIRPFNPKKAIKLADDKIKTKKFLSARGIPVPKLLGVIKDPKELEKYDFNSLPASFVVKPNKGFGGEGIIPIIDKKGNIFTKSGGDQMTLGEIKAHIRDILDGSYAISGTTDYAFFEQRIISDERIGRYGYEGLPDIRIIVHNLIPVMAMLRLPTKESKGKANLHQGAVGVGIDIAKGECTYIAYKNKIIEELPDGLGKIRGVGIPFWDKILEISSQVQIITNLGYLAADICIDKNVGPILLEINARAGLGVQIANLAPLHIRLKKVSGIKVSTPAKAVRIAKDMFGNIVEKKVEDISGKPIIGTKEKVEIIQKQNTFIIWAKIDTSKDVSIIDTETAKKIGLLDDSKNYDDEKSTLKIKFSLKGKREQTVVETEKIFKEEYKMILGKRDLKDFFIDPSQDEEPKKTVPKEPPKENKSEQKLKNKTINFHEVDQKLCQIDERIRLLYHLRPTNLQEAKVRFFNNTSISPQFEYPNLKFDPDNLREELDSIKTDNSPLGEIFKEKQTEIYKKILLLEAMDEDDFTKFSIELFGKPGKSDIEKCYEYIKELHLREDTKENLINAEEAKIEFEKVFEKYGLKNWQVKLKENMVTDCTAGKLNGLFLKKDALFTNKKLAALIVHEIETHILTAENGKKQPYEIFNRGLADYLITQEGLAIYNTEFKLNLPFSKNYKVMSNVIAIYNSLDHSFSETFDKLIELGIPKEQAFRSTLKAKRGFFDTSKKGAFTKDYLYFVGYFQIKNFVDNGGDIKDLYLGKINLNDLNKIKLIPGIIKPEILPDWFS